MVKPFLVYHHEPFNHPMSCGFDGAVQAFIEGRSKYAPGRGNIAAFLFRKKYDTFRRRRK